MAMTSRRSLPGKFKAGVRPGRNMGAQDRRQGYFDPAELSGDQDRHVEGSARAATRFEIRKAFQSPANSLL
jgi:hypothetical protein